MRQKIWRTPDEYIKNGFCINLNDPGKVEEFIRRQNSGMSISWKEFLKDSDVARTELFSKNLEVYEYRKQLIFLYAKWLCDNNLSDTKLFLDRCMPKLKLEIAENIIVQKSLRSKLSINYDRGFIEKLKEMQKKQDWVGLLSVAFRDTELQITQIPTSWEVCSSGISRLANLAVKVEIAPTADTKIRIMFDELLIPLYLLILQPYLHGRLFFTSYAPLLFSADFWLYFNSDYDIFNPAYGILVIFESAMSIVLMAWSVACV